MSSDAIEPPFNSATGVQSGDVAAGAANSDPRPRPRTIEPPSITTVGAPPTVTEHNNQLEVTWPNGKEATFIMRTTLFEAMITDINAAKRIATALDHIRATLNQLT